MSHQRDIVKKIVSHCQWRYCFYAMFESIQSFYHWHSDLSNTSQHRHLKNWQILYEIRLVMTFPATTIIDGDLLHLITLQYQISNPHQLAAKNFGKSEKFDITGLMHVNWAFNQLAVYIFLWIVICLMFLIFSITTQRRYYDSCNKWLLWTSCARFFNIAATLFADGESRPSIANNFQHIFKVFEYLSNYSRLFGSCSWTKRISLSFFVRSGSSKYQKYKNKRNTNHNLATKNKQKQQDKKKTVTYHCNCWSWTAGFF